MQNIVIIDIKAEGEGEMYIRAPPILVDIQIKLNKQKTA